VSVPCSNRGATHLPSLGLKLLTRDQGVNEFSHSEIAFIRLRHYLGGEVFIGEPERTTEGVLDEWSKVSVPCPLNRSLS
jgi:hypothetical protein